MTVILNVNVKIVHKIVFLAQTLPKILCQGAPQENVLTSVLSRAILPIICVIDGLVSYYFWAKGMMIEENPFMLKMLEAGPIFFFGVKVLQTLAAIGLGWLIWEYAPRMKVVYWIVVLLYIGVFVRAALSA